MAKHMFSPSQRDDVSVLSAKSGKSRAKSKADQLIQNRKYQASGADPNFYRKVSKYDLDRLSVDWKKLRKDKKS